MHQTLWIWRVPLCLLLLGAGSAWAADGDLLYGPGGAAALKARAKLTAKPKYGPAPATVVNALLARAKAFRTSPTYSYSHKSFSYTFSSKIPAPHKDHYPYWTALFQERADSISTRLNTLTFAYLVQGQSADLAAARDIALKLAAWSTWTDPDLKCMPGPACLDTGHAAFSMAYFYDAARTTLSAAHRKTIRDAIIKRGLEPLDKAAQDALTQKTAHNFHAIVAMGLGVGAAAVWGEDSRAPAWLARALALAKMYLGQQGADGGTLEYHGYGAYAMDHLVRLLQVAELRGQKVTAAVLNKVARFYFAALAPDGNGVGTFGDSWQICGAPMHHWRAFKGDGVAQAYLVDSGLMGTQDFITVVWARGKLKPTPLPPTPAAFTSVGLGALRSGAGSDAALLLLKAGPEKMLMGHNQKDHLSFQVWGRGAWLTGDPGYSKPGSQPPPLHRFYDEGHGHSAILLDGKGPTLKIGARLTRVAGGQGFGVICGEAAGAYAKGTVTSARRCALMHPGGFAVISDRVVTPWPQRVEWLFQPHRRGFASVWGAEASLYAGPAHLALRWASAKPALANLSQQKDWPSTVVVTAPRTGAAAVALADPGFEKAKFTGWTPRSTTLSAHTVETKQARGGKRSARISFAAKAAGYFYSAKFAATPGERVGASAYIKTAVTAGSARVRLLFYAKGKYLDHAPGASVNGAWGWHQRHVSGVVPAGADQLALALEFTGVGTAWFDDAALYRMPKAAQKTTTRRLLTLAHPTAAQPPVNGTFSLGMAFWTPRSFTLSGHAVVTNVHQSAPASARIQFLNKADAGYFYGNFLRAKPGDAVWATAWVRAQTTAGSGARLRVLFYDKNTYVSSAQAPYQKGATGWLRQQVNGTVPAGADRLRLSLEFTGQGSAWFDDVTYANLTSPLDLKQLAGPTSVAGGAWWMFFHRLGVDYLVLDASAGKVSGITLLGQASLDAGFAVHVAERKAPLILVDAAKLRLADGTRVELDTPSAMRLEESGQTLVVRLGPGSAGKGPKRALVELPGAAHLTKATVNGAAASWALLAADEGRLCWGSFTAGPCATAAADGGAPADLRPLDARRPDAASADAARHDAGANNEPKDAGCSCAAASHAAPATWPLLLALAALCLFLWRRRTSRRLAR